MIAREVWSGVSKGVNVNFGYTMLRKKNEGYHAVVRNFA